MERKRFAYLICEWRSTKVRNPLYSKKQSATIHKIGHLLGGRHECVAAIYVFLKDVQLLF